MTLPKESDDSASTVYMPFFSVSRSALPLSKFGFVALALITVMGFDSHHAERGISKDHNGVPVAEPLKILKYTAKVFGDAGAQTVIATDSGVTVRTGVGGGVLSTRNLNRSTLFHVAMPRQTPPTTNDPVFPIASVCVTELRCQYPFVRPARDRRHVPSAATAAVKSWVQELPTHVSTVPQLAPTHVVSLVREMDTVAESPTSVPARPSMLFLHDGVGTVR